MLVATASLLLWNEPSRRARRLIEERRASEALQVLAEGGSGEKSPSIPMLRASALHQLGRHGDELEAIQGLTLGEESVEPLLLEGLAEDFGQKESATVREALKHLPKESTLPKLQEVALQDNGKAQWGALRFIDIEYAGQGLPLVSSYSQALDPPDCRVRSIAARRLKELKHPDALPALQRLKDTPKRQGFLSDGSCGQDQAASAIRAIQREMKP